MRALARPRRVDVSVRLGAVVHRDRGVIAGRVGRLGRQEHRAAVADPVRSELDDDEVIAERIGLRLGLMHDHELAEGVHRHGGIKAALCVRGGGSFDDIDFGVFGRCVRAVLSDGRCRGAQQGQTRQNGGSGNDRPQQVDSAQHVHISFPK